MGKKHLFGFWLEHCGDGYPSLLQQPTGVLSEVDADRIATYLENCPMLGASPGLVYSLFHDGEIAGSGSVMTDGEWAWEDTMAYYVRRYRISPPIDFVRRIHDKGYLSPSKDELDVSLLNFPEGFNGTS
jgi:hypothetical protein